MSKSYFYRFVFELADPCTHDRETPLILEVERDTPMDNRLYRKLRRLIFSYMTEKYWSGRVDIFRYSDVEAIDPDYSKSFPKFIIGIDYTIYSLSTAVGVFDFTTGECRSCWTWPQRSTPYDWVNHAVHNFQIITEEV